MQGFVAVYLREMLILKRRFWRQLAGMAVSPLLYLIALGYAMGGAARFDGRTYLEFLIPGLIAMSSMTQSFGIATDINEARFYWYIFEEFQATPIRNAAYVAGEVLVGMTRALMGIGVILVLSLLFGVRLHYGPWLWLAVLAAVKQTLANQNRLTPAGQCSAKIHLERFRVNRAGLLKTVCQHLGQDQAALLRDNFTGIERDPVTVAAVAAMVHLKDKFAWGVLPAACWSEVMGAYAAQIACAVCGDYAILADYRKSLAPAKADTDNRAFVMLVCRAPALGFGHKWRDQG